MNLATRKNYYFLLLFVVTIILFLLGCDGAKLDKPLKNITIQVTGDEFNWYFLYPGEDGILDTADDKSSIQHLYLPDNAHITLDLKSKDYVYNFALPIIDKKEIAVPDLAFSLDFKTDKEATWVLLGDQFCGFSHDTLIGNVYVRDQSKENFYAW